MEIRRFFVKREINSIFVSDDLNLVHRISKVLRLSPGEKVILFNGDGIEYEAKIEKLDKKSATFAVIGTFPGTLTPHPEIFIYQALTKPLSKLETVMQKCTELGVTGIIPIITKRTEAYPVFREERWLTIIQEATEQCKRNETPSLYPPEIFEKLVVSPPEGINLIAYENEKETKLKSLLEKISNVKRINIFVGPEGGWEKDEISIAEANGLISFSLGKLILRTETCAPSILAFLRFSLT